MNAPLAHSPFGGSVAARILRCPASVGLVAKVPVHLRRVSGYADRGTSLHTTTTLFIDEKESLESLVGKTIGTYTITADDVENALRPVFTYIVALLDKPGAEFYLDLRVTFPGIPGAFGTLDLLIRIGRKIYVVDLKFGSGVRVLAIYPVGDDDIFNPQLMYYAAGARHSIPEFFTDVKTITLVILQPQSVELDADMVSIAEVTHGEIDEFITVFRAACEQALSPAPRLERGPHCRFCPARPICPGHTGPLLDLARFAAPTLRDTLVASVASLTG
jgi:hypothetical protein